MTPSPPSPIRVWLGERWSRVRDWLADMLPEFQLGDDGLRLLGWLATGVLVAIACGVLLHMAGVGATWWRSRERTTRSPGGVAATPRGVHDSVAEWDARARQLAEAGMWREAALALYQGVVHRLHAQGLLRYDPAKTPGDYRREIRDASARQRLEAFVRRFEPVAFGTAPMDGYRYHQLRALAAEVIAHG